MLYNVLVNPHLASLKESNLIEPDSTHIIILNLLYQTRRYSRKFYWLGVLIASYRIKNLVINLKNDKNLSIIVLKILLIDKL